MRTEGGSRRNFDIRRSIGFGRRGFLIVYAEQALIPRHDIPAEGIMSPTRRLGQAL
jgi:hypothetical protein